MLCGLSKIHRLCLDVDNFSISRNKTSKFILFNVKGTPLLFVTVPESVSDLVSVVPFGFGSF